MPPIGLGVQLGLGGGRSATSSGASAGGGGGAYSNNLSASFDGSGDNISLAVAQDFAGAFTLSFWFKHTISVNATLAYGTTGGGYIDARPATEQILVRNWGTLTVSAAYDFGDWNHFMLVRDSSDAIQVWVNGSSIGTSSKAGTINITRFGVYGTHGNPLGGLMDEIALWGSDQSSNVASIYNSGTPDDLGSFSPLSWWRMGDTNPASAGTAISSVTDVQGHNNLTQATAAKQPIISTDVP